MMKSVVPFFLNPGYLTNRFVNGERVSYVNPIRLYLIMSLVYFFIFNSIGTSAISDAMGEETISDKINDNNWDEADSVRNAVFEGLDSVQLKRFQDGTTNEFVEGLENLDDETKKLVLSSLIRDSVALALADVVDSTIEVDGVTVPATSNTKKELFETDNGITVTSDIPNDSTRSTTWSTGFLENYWDMDWEQLNNQVSEKELSIREIVDSMDTEGWSSIEKKMLLQTIRIQKADPKVLVSYFLNNLPLMMIFMLPIFALILKLLYVRRNMLYIKHLVHALHLHSLAYLLYGVTLLVTVYLTDGYDSLNDWITFLTFVLVSTYAYMSFRKVYQQGWFKTLVKFNMLGILYAGILMFALVAQFMLSFYTY